MQHLPKQERIRRFGEVFTPPEIASLMCNMLAENSDVDPYAPETAFLEPSCGQGVFVLEVLRRKFERCKTRKDFETAALSVWAIEIQPDNVQITIDAVLSLCREHFTASKTLEKEISDHIIMGDALKIMKLLKERGDGTQYIYVHGGGRDEP